MQNYPLIEPPKMTYYVRIRSNLTNQILTNWKFFDASLWYYGRINTISGGESEYIVELDIWNNEPAFNAGDYAVHNKNAINCRLNVIPLLNNQTDLFILNSPFLYGRCISTYKLESWTPITLNEPLTKLYGTTNPNQLGVLFGCADHMLIQTKIVIPPNSQLTPQYKYPFKLNFQYDYL